MVDKKSSYNTVLADKGTNHVGQLFDTNGAMKHWSLFKNEFSLSKNSHFYWIQLNNVIPKSWKENLYNGDDNFHDLTFRDTISLKSIRFIIKASVTVKSYTLYKSL